MYFRYKLQNNKKKNCVHIHGKIHARFQEPTDFGFPTKTAKPKQELQLKQHPFLYI